MREVVRRRQAYSAHLIALWGPPLEVLERAPVAGAPLAILRFGGHRMRGLRYATNGMAEWNGGRGDATAPRAEVYCATRHEAGWVPALLDAVARYPAQRQADLAPLDTIPLGRALDGARSPYRAILLGPPEPLDETEAGAIDGLYREPILLHRIIGIHDRELEYAHRRGADALWERLLATGDDLLADGSRPVAL